MDSKNIIIIILIIAIVAVCALFAGMYIAGGQDDDSDDVVVVNNTTEEEIDLVEIFYLLWNNFLKIVLCFVLGAVIAFGYSYFLITPMYKSSTSFVLSKSTESTTQSGTTVSEGITQSDVTLNSKLVSTYSEIIKSKTIAKEVMESLGLDMTVGEFRSRVTVSSKSDTELIEITVSNEDPETSAAIANSLAEVFRDKVYEVYKIDNLSVIDEAEPNPVPYNIGTVKNILLFAIVGLVLACGVIFIIVYFDDTVKEEKDVEALVNIPVIAAIPILEDSEGGKLKWKKAK